MEDPNLNSDRRTREALDELADMLLTGPVELPSPFVDRPEDPPAENDPQSPIRLQPDEPIAQVDPTLDAVIVGHLPGFAGPWIAQFADHTASINDNTGGLGLLRLAGSAIELELFADGKSLDTFANNSDEIVDLPTALVSLAERVGEYAVVIDHPDTERGRARLAAVDRWTVITAANDAAIVAAYRQLKALVVDAGVPVPPRGVRVSLMGCNENEAVAAAERLARAAMTHLRLTVKYAGFRQKMQPIRRAHLGRFDLGPDVDPWVVVHGFFQPPDAPAAPRSRAGSNDDPTSDLLTADELAALAAFDDDESLPTDHDADLDEAASEAATHAFGPHETIDAGAAIEPSTDEPPTNNDPDHTIDDELEQRLIRSMSEPDAANDEPADESLPAITVDSGSLAAYLADAHALQARCPHQPTVELAVENDGRVALMLNATGADTGPAIRSLLSARQWTIAHRALLALTDQAATIDPAADPVCHLFTDQPRVALELAYAGLTDTSPIRLHLLKSIDLDGKTTMVHEPLS